MEGNEENVGDSENTANKEQTDVNAENVEAHTGNAKRDAIKDASKKKVDVLLKATGDAPIMKKKKWAVDKNKQISYLIDFIKKYIKCESSESLFLYVNQTFVPSPDQLISNLYECFGTDGKLVLHYCKTQAWG